MRAVVQRVSRATVSVESETVGLINLGLMILVGFTDGDDMEKIDWITRKVVGLRIFDDEAGKMNRSVKDVDGSILVVSQFTLYGDVRKGNRPSYMAAAEPELARELYDNFCSSLIATGVGVETGMFGAWMSVDLCNEGPVTIIVER